MEPWTPDGVRLAIAAERPRHPLLAATGQFCDPVACERLTVLELVPQQRPRVVFDGAVPREEVAAVRALVGATAGECDTMAYTPWHAAWTTEGPFRYFTPRGEQGWVADGAFHIRGKRAIPVALIAHAAARLSADWVRREVGLVDLDGRYTPLVRQRDWAAMFSPTYDGLDLDFDAAWATAMGKAIADALGVPCAIDQDLLSYLETSPYRPRPRG